MLHVTLRVSFIQHTVFFSTVYVHLRHNRLCFSRTLDYTGTLTFSPLKHKTTWKRTRFNRLFSRCQRGIILAVSFDFILYFFIQIMCAKYSCISSEDL